MSKIADLSKFITELNYIESAVVHYYEDDVEVRPSGRLHQSVGTVIVAFEKWYQGTIDIERLPISRYSQNLLAAQISAWLSINDSNRLDSNIFKIIPNDSDNETIDVEININFNELVLADENENGEFDFNNKKYSLI